MKLKAANSNMAAMSVTIIAPNGVSLQLNGFSVNYMQSVCNNRKSVTQKFTLSTYVESPARTS